MEKVFDWDQGKNKKLARERGISFESIVANIEAGNLISVIPGRGRFGHQKQMIVLMNQYVYIVPCVETEKKIFLKTIIPSRKMTKRYLLGGQEYEA